MHAYTLPPSVRLTLSLTLVVFCLAHPRAHADSVTLNPVKDNTIYSEANNLSNGAGSYVFAGKTNGGNVRRALIAFNVAGAVPAGSTINSVTLELYMSRTQAGNETVSVHRISADWGEGTSNADQQEGNGTNATNNDATWAYRFYVVSNPGSSPAWTSAGVPMRSFVSWSFTWRFLVAGSAPAARRLAGRSASPAASTRCSLA